MYSEGINRLEKAKRHAIRAAIWVPIAALLAPFNSARLPLMQTQMEHLPLHFGAFRCAKPLDRLKQKYLAFQKRMVSVIFARAISQDPAAGGALSLAC